MNDVTCEICGKKVDDFYCLNGSAAYLHIDCLLRHRSTPHFNIRKCDICGVDLLMNGEVTPKEAYCHACSVNTHQCSFCGIQFLKDKLIHYERYYVCKKCQKKGEYLIRDYMFTPELCFYGGKKSNNSLFMGIELEVVSVNGYGYLNDIDKRYFFFKNDSSLPNGGVEIVSHPITFSYLKKHKEIINKNLIALASRKDAVSDKHGNCGLHIHLSRNCFGHFHIYKLLTFIYDKKNRNFLTVFSGRTEDQMDEYAHISCYKKDNKERAKYMNQGNLNRHHAVNISHRNTVELRIFEGTLDKIRLWAYIEFSQALFEFTKKTKIKNLTVDKFVEYIKSTKINRRRYVNCIKLIDKLFNKKLDKIKKFVIIKLER